MQDHIRNFAIIAHIDHGKSTLADRLLGDHPYGRQARHAGADSRQQSYRAERGITIKLGACHGCTTKTIFSISSILPGMWTSDMR